MWSPRSSRCLLCDRSLSHPGAPGNARPRQHVSKSVAESSAKVTAIGDHFLTRSGSAFPNGVAFPNGIAFPWRSTPAMRGVPGRACFGIAAFHKSLHLLFVLRHERGILEGLGHE